MYNANLYFFYLESHHVDALLYRAYLYYESTPVVNNWNLTFMATDHLNTHITVYWILFKSYSTILLIVCDKKIQESRGSKQLLISV